MTNPSVPKGRNTSWTGSGRGIRKADMGPTVWLKDLAPSSELRKWFSHEPEKWEEFRERNNAVVIREIIEEMAGSR